jgi:hypothetical protein
VDGSGDVQGYCAWQRGSHVGERGRLEVAELVSTTPGASRLLLRTLGSFASVAPTTRLHT